MKFNIALLLLSAAVMIVVIFQAVCQVLDQQNLETCMAQRPEEADCQEEAISEVTSKETELRLLRNLSVTVDELKKAKTDAEKSTNDFDESLQTCNTEEAKAPRETTNIEDTVTKVKVAPEVQKGDRLTIRSSVYSVLEIVGEGRYGKVALCSNLATNETVAVKILKKYYYSNKAKKEASTLAAISVLNPDHANIVKFLKLFEYRGHTCLALEQLDRSLDDALKDQSWNPLHLNEIRPIAKQLFVALEALKRLGILHTDLKPDNVMHVNRKDQPLRVKVIDFGEAMPALNALPGMDLQPLGYRAPEIVLGLPFTAAIDVWGVGCILSFLYLADDIFPFKSEYRMMHAMLDVLGQPSDHLLSAGIYTYKYFTVEETADGPTWKRKESPYEAAGWCLDDLVDYYPTEGAAEAEDTKAFVDLLKRLLHLDGDLRLSPHEALQHPFITMSHLTDHPDSRDYLTTARTKMEQVDTSGALGHNQELLGSPSGGDRDTSSDG